MALRCAQLAVARPTVSVGPSVPEAAVDAASARRLGYEVVRRRSGGGAVLLRGPGHEVWVDVEIGRDDPRWQDDVGRAMWWVGDAWAAALGRGEVWRRPLERRPGGDVACWASVGPGEVVDGEGRKLVGISARRTRQGALYQCCAYLVWDHGDLEVVLGLAPGTLASAGAAVDGDGLAARLARALGAACSAPAVAQTEGGASRP